MRSNHASCSTICPWSRQTPRSLGSAIRFPHPAHTKGCHQPCGVMASHQQLLLSALRALLNADKVFTAGGRAISGAACIPKTKWTCQLHSQLYKQQYSTLKERALGQYLSLSKSSW